MKNIETAPVLLIVFNRLENTKKVFEQIRKSKPSKLYISSDAPRDNRPEEKDSVFEIREYLLASIDWKCEVKTLFQTINQGCRFGPEKAISWLFEHEEKGIILEDDCVPSESFFKYTSELLNKYEDDFRVFGISGANFQTDKFELEHSYYFSDFFMTWGWATWRSRWKKHQFIMDNHESYLEDSDIKKLIHNKVANKTLLNYATKSYKNELDAWDYQWILSCMINNGLIITPTKNLIHNIGFGSDATHTTSSNDREVKHQELEFPLSHPKIISANREIDNSFFKHTQGWLSDWDKITSFNYLWAAIDSKMGRVFNQKR